MRNRFAAGLYTSREGWDFKNISEVGSPIACQSASSEDHLIVSEINYALETLLLWRFLFIRILPGISGNTGFYDDMTNYVSHVANARDI